jgi:hypothetical protein
VEFGIVGPARHTEPHLHLGQRGAGGKREQHSESDTEADLHATALSGVRGEATSHAATASAIPAALASSAAGPLAIW